MQGTSEEIETLRRYPTAWKIITFLLAHLPLSRLARTLSDLSFHAILFQSLSDVTNTADIEPTYLTKGKRKYRTDIPFDLKALSTPDTSLLSAESILSALLTLLGRVQSNEQTDSEVEAASRSCLISSFAAIRDETILHINKILTICKTTSVSAASITLEGEEQWLSLILPLWKMRQASADDAREAAREITPFVFSLWRELSGGRTRRPTAVQDAWRQDLENFWIQVVMYPSKIEFDNSKSLAIPEELCLLTMSATFPLAIHFLFKAAYSMGQVPSKVQREYYYWIRSFFVAFNKRLRNIPWNDGRKIVAEMLIPVGSPTEFNSAIGSEILRDICIVYALAKDETSFELVLRTFQHPDVYLGGEAGRKTLAEVFERIEKLSHAELTQQNDIILSIIILVGNGFAEAGFLCDFLIQWMQHLSRAEKDHLKKGPVWFAALEKVETRFRTPRQLKMFLNQLEEGKYVQSIHPHAILAVLAAIARHLTAMISYLDFSDWVKAARTKLHDIAHSVISNANELPASIAAYHWEIISATVSWVSMCRPVADCLLVKNGNIMVKDDHDKLDAKLWNASSKRMFEILRSGNISDIVTFEAMRACTIWADPWTGNCFYQNAVEVLYQFLRRLTQEFSKYEVFKLDFNDKDDCSMRIAESPKPASDSRDVFPLRYLQAFFLGHTGNGAECTDLLL